MRSSSTSTASTRTPSPSSSEGRSAHRVDALARDVDEEYRERTEREARLLFELAERETPFAIPRVLGIVPDRFGPAMVQVLLDGITLDGRAGRQTRIRPWAVIGELAAQVHAISLGALADGLLEEASPRAHVERRLEAVFTDDDEPELRDARAWALAHLPAADATPVLLHGDLLPQNVRVPFEGPVGLLDWEYARIGDPAYDLAIVTRGVRRPFQIDGGLERLIEAYVASGGREMTASAVRVHELCLLLAEHRAACRGEWHHAPEQTQARLRGFVRRLP